jgi:hypothetical protein
VKGDVARTHELFGEVLRAVRGLASARDFLRERGEIGEVEMIGLLRLAVPVALLEALAQLAPWSERPRVLGAVCLNGRAPRALCLRLLPALYWRDLADVATSPRVEGGVRARAEALLKERLPDLRLGERITLGRFATPAVLRALLADSDARVLGSALQNPRLAESDLAGLLQRPDAPRPLAEAVAASARWQSSYAVRLALVLQPRTPVAIALAQLSSLQGHDLRQIAANPSLAPLVQAAAARVAAGPGRG